MSLTLLNFLSADSTSARNLLGMSASCFDDIVVVVVGVGQSLPITIHQYVLWFCEGLVGFSGVGLFLPCGVSKELAILFTLFPYFLFFL